MALHDIPPFFGSACRGKACGNGGWGGEGRRGGGVGLFFYILTRIVYCEVKALIFAPDYLRYFYDMAEITTNVC